MGDTDIKLFKIQCIILKEDIDIIFNAIDFYRDCSILFTKDKEISKKCNEVWYYLNECCTVIDDF